MDLFIFGIGPEGDEGHGTPIDGLYGNVLLKREVFYQQLFASWEQSHEFQCTKKS